MESKPNISAEAQNKLFLEKEKAKMYLLFS